MRSNACRELGRGVSRGIGILLLLSACGKDRQAELPTTPFAGREALSVFSAPGSSTVQAAANSGSAGVSPVFRAVEGQPGWLCGDLGVPVEGTGVLLSLWYRVSAGPGSVSQYTGSCASFAYIGPNRLCSDSLDGNGWSAHFDTSLVRLSFRRATCDYAEANSSVALAVAAAILLAPSALAARELGAGIALSWRDNSVNEGNMVVERAVGNGPFSTLRVLGPNVVAYTDTNVASGMAYTYRLRAYDSAGYSPYSNTVSVNKPLPSPTAPSGLTTVSVSRTSITVRWNSTGAGSYLLERPADGVNYRHIVATGAAILSWRDDGLAPNTRYYYRVRASYNGTLSGYSPVHSVPTTP